MIKISPSILAADFANLERDISRVSSADYLHVDVMDGLFVEDFCKAGADIVTVHVEADTEENTRLALERVRALGKRAGVVLKPKTPAEAALPFLDQCAMVLVMTVEPGFGGQSFMEDMLEKVRTLRGWINGRGLDCELEVDGGIGPRTAPPAVEAGANVLVAGSAVYGAEDIPARIAELRG